MATSSADGHIVLQTEVDTDGIEKGSSKIKSALGGVGKAVAGITASVAAFGVAAVTAFVKGAKTTAQMGDRVDKLSQKIGMSRKAFQQWDYVLSQNGASIESLQVGMKTLSNAVVSGNEAFKQLGITQEELNELDKEEIFERTIEALQEMPESAERTALATELLGRSATDLEPLLNSNAESIRKLKKEAEDYGMVMSDASVTASAAFNDSIDKMQRAMQGFKDRLTAEYLPALTKVTDGLALIFSGDAEKGIKSIGDGIEEFINKLADDLPVVVERIVEIVIKLIGSIIDAFPNLIKAIVDALPGIVKKIAQALPKLIPQLIDAIVDCILYIVQNIGEIIGPLIDALPDIIMSIINAIADNLPKLIEGGTDLLNAIIKLIPKILEAVATVVPQLLSTVIGALVSAIPDLIKSLVSVLWETAKSIPESIIGLFRGLWDGLTATEEEEEKKETEPVIVRSGRQRNITGTGNAISGSRDLLNPGTYNGEQIRIVASLPQFATGAVIPPNNRFLAVLGDQTSGTNVEAPLETIQQAVADVFLQYASVMNANSQPIILEVDSREIARAARRGETVLGSQNGGFAYAY